MTAASDPLSDEQREIRELVRTLARERIAPRAAEIDRTAEFPWDVVVVRAGRKTYCIESTVDGVTVSKAGPAAELAPRSC